MEISKREESPIKIYRRKMKDIKFMKQFVEEPDIFNPESEKFKDFLTQSYIYLNPDFQYLSYSLEKNIDQELVEASQVLQILPDYSFKKLFGYMKEAEIHSFWLRFFSLFHILKEDKQTNVNSRSSCSKKFDFFKSIDETLNYVNFSFPILNAKKVKNIDANKEVEKWSGEKLLDNVSDTESIVFEFEDSKIDKIFVEKLMIDLKQVVVMYNNLHVDDKEIKPEYDEFFKNFISLTKNIIKYKNDFAVVDSSILEDFHVQCSNANFFNSTDNKYFLKKLNNLTETLKARIHSLNKM